MYFIKKRIEVAYAHQLKLNYESPCTRLHGHNAIIWVYCGAEELDQNGMVVDFAHVSKIIKELLDHQFVNDQMVENSTAENIARLLCEKIPHCYKVCFQESEHNMATYVKDEALSYP